MDSVYVITRGRIAFQLNFVAPYRVHPFSDSLHEELPDCRSLHALSEINAPSKLARYLSGMGAD